MNKRSHIPAGRGTTLTELLVVLVIISLLATIAVPVYVNKSRQAQIAVAQAEIREIGQALKQCAIIHGYLVPLQMLDDLAPGLRSGTSSVPVDDLDNYPGSGSNVFLIDPIGDINDQVGNQLTLADRLSNSRILDLYQMWNGPFLTTQRVYIDDPNQSLDETDARRDFPLDPSGQPYRLYSPLGLVGDGAYLTQPDNWNQDNAFNGALTNRDDRFDRFAIVSFGADTISAGEDTDADDFGDDIVHLLMGMTSESSFRAFY